MNPVASIWIAALVLGLDRLTKYWVLKHLLLFYPLFVTPFFNLTLAYNKGAAFSFLNSASGWQNIVLGSFAIIMSVIVLVWLLRLPSKARWMMVALNFILGGALGNLWDRFQFGYVIDFLDFHLGEWHFPIFNIADSGISIGAFMILLFWLRQSKSS